MDYDPSTETVTARVNFVRVMLMCINGDKQCEVGVIVCPKHATEIRIRKFVNDQLKDDYKLRWPNGNDLIFNVKKAVESRVIRHRKASGQYAFSKVVNLEGRRLHNKKVTVLPENLKGRRLGFTAGKLYSVKPTDHDLELQSWIRDGDKGKDEKKLGRITQEVGLNINCRNAEGAGIDILDSFTGKVIQSLPASPDTYYLITVDNDCTKGGSPPKSQVGSDFRYFYKVVQSPTVKKFDLREIGDPTSTSDPFPGVCETVMLSKTKTLGLTWPKL